MGKLVLKFTRTVTETTHAVLKNMWEELRHLLPKRRTELTHRDRVVTEPAHAPRLRDGRFGQR